MRVLDLFCFWSTLFGASPFLCAAFCSRPFFSTKISLLMFLFPIDLLFAPFPVCIRSRSSKNRRWINQTFLLKSKRKTFQERKRIIYKIVDSNNFFINKKVDFIGWTKTTTTSGKWTVNMQQLFDLFVSYPTTEEFWLAEDVLFLEYHCYQAFHVIGSIRYLTWSEIFIGYLFQS